jgi:hypothetical protein
MSLLATIQLTDVTVMVLTIALNAPASAMTILLVVCLIRTTGLVLALAHLVATSIQAGSFFVKALELVYCSALLRRRQSVTPLYLGV